MKKNFFFAALSVMALLALSSCGSGNSPDEDTTKLWPAGDGSGKYGYIDQNGEMVLEARYAAASRFSAGYALVKNLSGSPVFINKKGAEKSGDMFTEIVGAAFYYNYASARNGGKYGLMNKKLKYAVSPKYAAMSVMTADGLIAASSDGVKWGYINRSGEQIIEEKYAAAYDFVDGLAVIQKENGKYGCIDLSGQERIVANYEYLQTIGQDCIIFLSDDKFGILDVSGIIKVPAEYDVIASAQRWTEGWLPAMKDGKWGYIDQNGKTKIDFTYDGASMFSEGYAIIETDGLFSCIDVKGNIKFNMKRDEYPLSISDASSNAVFFRGFHNGLIATQIWDEESSEVTCNYRDALNHIVYSWKQPISSLRAPETLSETSLTFEQMISEPHNLFDPDAVAF